MNINEATYLKALKSTLERICFERSSGKTYDFTELFYPLDIDEGKVAFQSYSEQMDKVRQSSDKKSNSHFSLITKQVDKTKAGEIVTRIQNAKKNIGVKGNFTSEVALSECDIKENYGYNDNKTVGKSIIEKIKYQQKKSETKLSNTIENKYEQCEIDLLLEEEKSIDNSSLIIEDKTKFSRILAVASAGYGKTTLLRRIALYYCESVHLKPKDVEIKRKYLLNNEKYVPCIIQLRDISDCNFSVDKAIEDAILNVFNVFMSNNGLESDLNRNEIIQWINNIKSSILLLVDGLDELSDSTRLNFLLSLDDYLSRIPETHVIITSRVAGLSERGVKDALRKMRFRGRSIVPLSDDKAKEYSENWIKITQPKEKHIQFFDTLDQILNQNRFKYLRDFMRTPLELIVILKQLANDSLSLNRYQMFYDMLWELFTNHVNNFDEKRVVFDDTMTLLSFIAYKMQLNETLYLSKKEIESLVDDFAELSFYSNIINAGMIDDYIVLLDDLSANIGIMEKDDRDDEPVYTFPIRAYQEFLTAHACCHLSLLKDTFRPTPKKIVEEHIFDTRWISIINFILSDLDNNNQDEFDSVVNILFDKVNSLEQLRTIVEADLTLSRAHAKSLCEKIFSPERLNRERLEILCACLNSKSGYAFHHFLKNAYSRENDKSSYLEASAFSSLVWEYNYSDLLIDVIMKELDSTDINNSKKAALIVSQLALAKLGEGWINVWDKMAEIEEKDLTVTKTLISLLERNAKRNKDMYSITALTNLWLSMKDGTKIIGSVLTSDLAEIVIKYLNNCVSSIPSLFTAGAKKTQEVEYNSILELVYTLGSFPINSSNSKLLLQKNNNIIVSAFMDALYNKSKDDLEIDQVAIAIACFFYFWDVDRFIESWGGEICKGMSSEFVRKDLSCTREQNHFYLSKSSLINFEKAYAKKQEKMINKINTTNRVFDLFRAGKIYEAAQFCARSIDEGKKSNSTNLAFLIRYGLLDGSKILDGEIYDVRELLATGIEEKDCFALMNLILFEISEENLENANELIGQMNVEDWETVTHNFWLPELWLSKRDPEGALVCVLARKYGGCCFDEYQEMLDSVKNNYASLNILMN